MVMLPFTECWGRNQIKSELIQSGSTAKAEWRKVQGRRLVKKAGKMEERQEVG